MRIAFIYPRLTGPYGGERLLSNLSEGLKKHGDKVDIYSRQEKIKLSSNIASLIDFFYMPFLVRKISKKYDLVIAMGWQSAFGGYLYNKYFNPHTKLIYYALEPPRFLYDLNQENIILTPLFKLIKTVDKISVQNYTNIISISEWTAQQLNEIYGKDSVIIYPGVETGRFKKYTKLKARQLLKIPTKKSVYLSVSKIHKRKRLDKAINYYLKHKKQNSVFYIIGEGPEKNNLKKIISERKLKDVFILGEKTDQEVALYMRSSDYFIFTAIREPFGIAPLEAKIAGAKVVPHEPLKKILDVGEATRTNRKIFYEISTK